MLERKKLKLDSFVQDKVHGVYLNHLEKRFNYSDGDDVENRLYNVLLGSEFNDVFSSNLVSKINDWASEYHFSPRRSNIIRPFSFLGSGTKVLELGAGFGAITKALAELECDIDAVEGSFRRASAAAARLRGHKNTKIFVSNFQDIEFEPIYDVVTLIGVLEYAPVYISAEDPFVECLRMAASALKPDGKLIIAIENRLGLKYLAGITEDHYAIPYYGVEGRYGSREITTYGKKQLINRLERAGFSSSSFFYPYPDYKLPEVILTDCGVNDSQFNAGDLVSQLENRDYSGKGVEKFRLDLAWDSVAREGLLDELSNSFLILASRLSLDDSVDKCVLAEKYSDDRRPNFNTVSRFSRKDDEILVAKLPLSRSPHYESSLIRQSLNIEPYIVGGNLLIELKRALSNSNSDRFSELLRLWVDFVNGSARDSILPGFWVDAHPGNVIINSSGVLTLIDREWESKKDCSVAFVLAYGLFILAHDNFISNYFKLDGLISTVIRLASLCRISIDNQTLNSVVEYRNRIWHDVYEGGIWKAGGYRSKEFLQIPNIKRDDTESDSSPVRLLAFYLPQFHTIPENDRWWGEGFTEWTNVRQAKPLFEGHEQPLVPTELGYYDLSTTETLVHQAELARAHGIFGFCFYYYWFDGQRLLEKPVDQLLRAVHIDLPFCLCWANENWTRRWDGGEQEVLVKQSYSASLNSRFASDLIPYFSDPRYIRVDGKPVLLVYRTDIIPDLAATVSAWRAGWRAEGVGEVYLVAVESFRAIVPEDYGFDAAAEFPPHQVNFALIPPDLPPLRVSDPSARIGDYNKLRKAWLARPTPRYKRLKGLLPSWDNTSRRRKGGATLFVNASPEGYESWLTQSVARTLDEFQGDERLVFVNAWNEWAEGCTLEPTARHGRAYLEATQRVMARDPKGLLAELTVSAAVSDPLYQRWIQNRPDRITTERAQNIKRPTSRTHITVLVGRGEGDCDLTTKSLNAQLRKADAVIDLSTHPDPIRMVSQAEASWVVLLTAGDVLEADALLRIELAATEGEKEPPDIIYFGHDEQTETHAGAVSLLKPAFNHDLLLSYPYLGRAIAVRASRALDSLVALPVKCDLVLAYRLALRAFRDKGETALTNIPSVLAHLDAKEPTVFCQTSESWQALAGVLQEHLEHTAPGAQVLEGPAPGTFHVIYPLDNQPLVSVVIPTREQLPLLSRCIQKLLDTTSYQSFELLIVDNDSQSPEALAFLSGLEQVDPSRIRVLRVPGPFNFSRMNNLAVKEARGEYVLLLNNDTAALQADWLSHMMRHALRDDVGVVGARLVYPEGTVQHAGVIMGLRGPADHPCLGLKPDEPGYMFRAQLTQNFSAVTAACMLVSKAVYEEVGGFDEDDFAVSYNDIDFCLKVGQTGRCIVWTPLATLLHEGSASQKASIENLSQANKSARFSKEQAAMYRKWPEVIANDPAYNPNLSLVERGYEVETNPLLCYDPLRDLYEHKVVAFAADNMGCGNYRVLQPMQAMLKDDLCIGGASPEIFGPNLALRSRADVLVFQRPNDDQSIHTLESLISLKGIKKIYEVDDNLTRVPYQSIHHKQMPKDIRKRMIKSIGLCDRLIVSTQPLAEEFKHANDDVRVVLNRLPPAMWGESPPVTALRDPSLQLKPVVAWAGGVGHGGDLALVAQVVKELADVVDWEFFGMCPDSIRPYVKRVHTGVPTLEYPAKLMQLAQNWDLAIAPLEVNAFNESKSNLRLLEYGWCGLPVVCSDVTPYQDPGFPVTRVKNRYKDWKAAILERVTDLESVRQQGLALQAVVQRDWMLKGEHVVNWYKAWTD